jgi:serine/threonine-protein kinase HipA
VPPSNRALEVHASGKLTGTLSSSDLEFDTFLFGYKKGTLAEDAVSLTMPIVGDQYDSMGTVHPIFEMNLPEGALLERLRLSFAKTIPDLDSLGLLALVGQSQIGRLRYSFPGHSPSQVPAQNLNELLTFKGTEDLFQDLLERYAIFSGISGMQPKVLVRDSNVPLLRLTERGATHIVKSFDDREYPELAANEYFCMQAAKAAGISIPNVHLSVNRRILLVERFDLTSQGTYLGCEDFCVLSALRSHGRYEGSYELIAKRIGQFITLEEQSAALQQLFAIVALCCAIENGDAHLKNFAVLYEGAESTVRLAPAYDLVSTTIYHARDAMALELGKTKAFPERERLIAFGRQACALSSARIKTVLDQVEHGIQVAQAQIRKYMREHSGFSSAGERLLAAMKRGLDRSIRH